MKKGRRISTSMQKLGRRIVRINIEELAKIGLIGIILHLFMSLEFPISILFTLSFELIWRIRATRGGDFLQFVDI